MLAVTSPDWQQDPLRDLSRMAATSNVCRAHRHIKDGLYMTVALTDGKRVVAVRMPAIATPRACTTAGICTRFKRWAAKPKICRPTDYLDPVRTTGRVSEHRVKDPRINSTDRGKEPSDASASNPKNRCAVRTGRGTALPTGSGRTEMIPVPGALPCPAAWLAPGDHCEGSNMRPLKHHTEAGLAPAYASRISPAHSQVRNPGPRDAGCRWRINWCATK